MDSVGMPSYKTVEYVKLVSQRSVENEYEGNCNTRKRDSWRGNRLGNWSTQHSGNLPVDSCEVSDLHRKHKLDFHHIPKLYAGKCRSV